MNIDTSMKVIVIDDMMTMRKILSKMLKEIGFSDITEADDGASAWPLIEEAHNTGKPYQLIVSDWNMPNMSGLDLLLKVKDTEGINKAAFLMITAEAEQSKIINVVEAGASDFLVKPFKSDALKDKINKIFS
tara:strand:+ start:8710 stop:9105 length:396 start_codon:yes stop_codon:yes gene_type:complete